MSTRGAADQKQQLEALQKIQALQELEAPCGTEQPKPKPRPKPIRSPFSSCALLGALTRLSVRARMAIALISVIGTVVCLPGDLPAEVRLALFAFAAATVLWTLTDLEPGYVALGAGLLVCIPTGRQEEFFSALGNDVVWLIIGAFIIGGATAGSGLAARLTGAIIGRARSVRGLMWLVTAAVVPLSFLVPSTSGRAAVLLPVYRSLTDRLGDARIAKALGLLMPTVVLVSTTATLVGATSHLVAVDLLQQTSGDTISYLQWALWGAPFGIAASVVVCLAVQVLFLRREERRRPIMQPTAPATTGRSPLTRAERTVSAVVALALVGWLTEPLHGLGIAAVTIIAAVVLCLPGIGVMKWKEGVASVSWPLVLFVAGALALGSALVETGAGDWIVSSLFALSGVAGLTSALALVVIIAALSVTAHLYVTSHTVRAIALIPPFLALAATADLSPVAVAFIVSIGLDYCLTLPVSSKALLVFTDADGNGQGLDPRDLLRLSLVLLPAYIGLMVVTYELWWKHTGLAL
ncbi:sodium:solute symporter [Pseudoclavibacter sp. AY1F1]|uniref:SLC13 family permease n=1 Tax=Pseudoclavibacter sp. AY1F1 TaxID=2080583 RepID=UPI000CE7DB2D|nr:SLC13 family permease [Pseudoclavibacter sp. AY1F1]PPF44441.1 sodium:solute symporter [Pseudoclavibacter sp. AY1F1]